LAAQCRCGNNAQTRSRSSTSGQPFLTIGGGGGAFPFPLPRPAQPETLTAMRVATKANNTFFIVGSPFSRQTRRFVPRSHSSSRRSHQRFTAAGDPVEAPHSEHSPPIGGNFFIDTSQIPQPLGSPWAASSLLFSGPCPWGHSLEVF